jgi:hypothetical protein
MDLKMNKTWMMWLDGDTNKTTEEAIREAMAYYRRKYGINPNRVQIPLKCEDVYMEDILIERDSCIQENHLLITMDREVEGLNRETGGKGGR